MNVKSISNAPPRRARVLCADDEVSITSLLQRLLRAKGYEVQVTNDGLAALSELQTHPEGFDLVISDHDMPGLTGLELVQQARASGCEVRFIIFSGSVGDELHECYADLGVIHRLPKPGGLSVLIWTVEELLNESANP